MILEILADSGQVVDRCDLDLAQLLGGSDARAQEQFGGGQGTGGEDDLVGGDLSGTSPEIDLETGDLLVVDEQAAGVPRRGLR